MTQQSFLTINSHPSFEAFVTYVQPSLWDLLCQFSSVDPEYKDRKFEPIESCKNISTTNRQIVFEYVQLHRRASTEAILAETYRRGLRPALYEELLGFLKKYFDEQQRYPIVALGSMTYVRGRSCVSCPWRYGIMHLGLAWVEGDWEDDGRFLAVRE